MRVSRSSFFYSLVENTDWPSPLAETAPLLNDDSHHLTNNSTLNSILKPGRPLTNLEKALAGIAILFLLLASTFIGLFAGAEGMLKKEQRKEGKVEWKTQTLTATSTRVSTTTVASQPTGKPQAVSCDRADLVGLADTRPRTSA